MPIYPNPNPTHEDHILISTTSCFDPKSITKHYGLLVAEKTYANDIKPPPYPSPQQNQEFIDQFNAQSNIARDICLKDLKLKALKVGANAVIQVDLDYTEFALATNSTLLVITISGSAVYIDL